MFQFEPLFKEGQCYSISNFAIAENNGKLPPLPHKYKISFYKGTVVTRIDPFDKNLNGFILESFNRLLDGTRHYHEHEAVGRMNTPKKEMSLAMLSLFFNLGKYKVIMRIIDQSGSAPIVFFNTMINKLSGYTAWELMERHRMDVDEYWPGELLDLVGKRFLFKIYFSDYNVNNNNHTYRCDAVNDDPEFIKHFKDGFMQDEDYEDAFTTPANKIKVNNFTDDCLNLVLEMPPQSIEMGASGSASGFGRKRVFVDLDEIDCEDEVEGCNSSNIQKIIRVKVEKEDP
nr:replication protein A 70 kDa DNA-binding subunit B [Tanacetum cinerariifolium]